MSKTSQDKIKIEVAGISFLLSKKKIRSLRIKILPPQEGKESEIRVSAPSRLSIQKIKEFISKKIDWIKEKQAIFQTQEVLAPLRFISGENHFFFGEKYELAIFENSSANKVLLNGKFMELHFKNSANLEKKIKAIDSFYRAQLKKIIPELIEKYEEKMQVQVREFGVKKMKTRWGTCNPRAQRIWLSLELAKRPPKSLELIVVHEMTHLLERKHNKNFYSLMDKFMPDWKVWQDELKQR